MILTWMYGVSVDDLRVVCGVETELCAEALIVAECCVDCHVGDLTSEVADYVSSGGTGQFKLVDEMMFQT